MKQKIVAVLYLTAAAVSQMALPFVVNAAYAERGYFALGGEWVLLGLSVLLTVVGIEKMMRVHKVEDEELRQRYRQAVSRGIKRLCKAERDMWENLSLGDAVKRINEGKRAI